jgi:magnesium chelatase subunit D
LHDLAIAASVFEAAKYWAIRRTHGSHNDKWLIVRPSDLRQYRRLPVPETLLVLVIDYTALRKCAWEDALITHLEWAYTSRAGIALIRVGAKDSPHELRAEQILGRSLLAPQIDLALEAESGRATPLAHGLELASQTLRHAMLHGRAAMSKARLVVLTDGRGNVPLAASYAGKVVTPVNREGIDDALAVAAQIRSVSSLEIVFLDPQPSQHSELPLAFANALGVEPTPVPRHQSSHTPVGHRAQETQV